LDELNFRQYNQDRTYLVTEQKTGGGSRRVGRRKAHYPQVNKEEMNLTWNHGTLNTIPQQ
jgi:hypothetical protein